ncbi:hypothetical protein [Crocosphaera watsonii]|uniref:Biosynthetic Aromatic amino acid aminotransferase alpha @ Aspartate aminotransferase n=1 Tax=Crocosphaera watsonii WH 0401 TaxID=555881 RepID=T2J476_CROWT|nr:hypothetical protein [Crocosphaera watsonii]CCQ60030.1 Biosynthetic Aromatic amino acid aminotransferase alpha @ Aspartate aminotransferase [Crocosphaera watsonii WH 0401]
MNQENAFLPHVIAPKLLKIIESQTPIGKFYKKATYMSLKNEPGSLDFTIGDSHEMPLHGFVEALKKNAIPQKIGWYGYKVSLPETKKIVSEALKNIEVYLLSLMIFYDQWYNCRFSNLFKNVS